MPTCSSDCGVLNRNYILDRFAAIFTKLDIDFAAKSWYNCIINKEEKEKRKYGRNE